ncbi:alsin-like isoform 3-T3 [Synchiropus picturatus]
MDNFEESPEDERPLPERGLLHIWQTGNTSEPPQPERVLFSKAVLQVALGERHGLLLTEGGQVYSFGELLWRGLRVPVTAPVLEVSLQGRMVVRVVSGGFHCGALSEQGNVYMWGENTAGQCGLTDRGTATNVSVAEPYPVTVVDDEAVPPTVVRVMDLACGREHTLALSSQSELWAWGSGCQLGLVTNTFPVWRPQKVEHLAGKHVTQIACGAYHSLALVRALPQHNNNKQKPPEKEERGCSPRHSLTGKEQPPATEDTHYCPLGVELTDGPSAESSPRIRSASKRPQQRGRRNLIVDPVITAERGKTSHHVLSSGLPDEFELHSLLQKLNEHSIDAHHNSSGLGDTDSQSSHTSDGSCVSSDILTSSYKSDSPVRNQSYSSSVPGCLSSSPLCLDEVNVLVERSGLQGKKSSSLTDISKKLKLGTSSRRSTPGTPVHGSPHRRRTSASGSSASTAPKDPGEGMPLLETEVWSWGRGSEGQLGHGDQLARLQPLCIKSLTGEEVIKVAAGSHHSLAITAQCQVYSWGSNMCGQLGHINNPVTVPQETKLSDGLRVWDVAAGQSHSLLLADGDCVQPVMLYCGQQQESRSVQDERSRRRSPNRAEKYSTRPTLLPFCIEMIYISSVSSGGQSCAVLADRNIMGYIYALHDLASRERRFYCWLSNIRKKLLTPLSSKESGCPSFGESCSHLFLSLCESFVRLSLLVGRHSVSLTYFLHKVQSQEVTSLHLLTHTDHFLDVYEQYCSSVGDFQVMGGFQLLHKLSQECLGSQKTKLHELCESDPSITSDGDVVSDLLYHPLHQLHQYSQVLLKLTACYDVLAEEYHSLYQCCDQYETLYVSLLKRKKEAEATFHFWKKHSGKITEVLRLPRRRMICESSNRSLTLQNAGRFTNHWFILFNDVLVHTQGAIPSQSFFSTHHIYSLTCLWVKPIPENDSGLYAIKVTCPEESFTLVASTPQEKNKWLHCLNHEVDRALGGGGHGSAAAMSRLATYSFTGEGRFKDAHYSGAWLAGRVHGRGTMKWPDGRTYSGNFKNGLEDGLGECIIPNKLLSKPDSYHGNWKEGKIHGFGKYIYANGEVYEGCFFDGQKHGYGMMSSGKLTRSSSSVFIGQWVNDKKTGYGVCDDITRGEKYMGQWLDDQRHGTAIVVTQHGVYFEGNFKEHKMNGPGLLVSEDDTVLHAEFTDDWMVNGKGILCLPNGDCLDGMFTGEWSTGLKVVATYTKQNLDEPENKERNKLLRLGQYVVDARQRWSCVFHECWTRLGCHVAGSGDRTAAWESIAVNITNACRQSPDLSKSQRKVLESLELIPQYGAPVTISNYDSVRRYLTKACETPFHPLGWLVETLVTVYRMTYIGVGSNHRLLREAVQEVQAYLTHFYSVVRFLFPGLPDDGGVIPETPVTPSKTRHFSFSSEQSCVVVVSCSSLLLPLLLPRLYPPLFTLYCLRKEQEEAQYWEHVIRLNKQPDQSLLNFLGVQEKFWPSSMSVLGEQMQIVSSSKDACFVSAVETLQQISTTFTPADKLLVIQKTFEELTQEIQPTMNTNFLWCMDDLLPLFLYIVLRARIRNLGAEVSLTEDLMDPNVQYGEMGLMFTTLKACYIQIQQESTA